MIDLPMPAWLTGMPADEKTAALARFRLKVAALYASPEGQLKLLSEQCDYNADSLAAMRSISPETAIKIEGVLGRELFPREFFRPDLFLTEK